MKTVVITGSTRGIGLGLAKEFLEAGCNVVICGRTESTVQQVINKLARTYPAKRIFGQACDVGDYEQVVALWDATVKRFGQVDIWINNAALGNDVAPLWEQLPTVLENIIQTNITGTVNGCHVALDGMIKQGYGHVFNMEGYGSGGEIRVGNTPYGMTKRTISYLTKALQAETKDTPVSVSIVSPGMVPTELLMQSQTDDNVKQFRSIVNILGDKVETVSPYLAQKILYAESSTRIVWLNRWQILMRFLTAPFNKRDLFAETQS